MLRSFLVALILVSIAVAFQDSLAALKLTREAFDTNVSNYVTRELSDDDKTLALPFIGSAQRPLFLAMSDATRATVVKELGLAAKAMIMSPAFLAAYNQKLKSQHNAVDHGLKVTDSTAAINDAAKTGDMAGMQKKIENMMRDQLKQMVLDQQKQIASFDGETVKGMADGMKAQMESIPPANAAEKAMHAKANAQLSEAMKLSSSDLPKARELFRTGSLYAVFVEAGNVGGAQMDQGKKEQQINYDKRALRPRLKQQLLAFVTEAKSVDFKAATQAKGSSKVFVNAAYERKSPLWKLVYRLGPGGAAAAIAVAQGWAAEL